MEQKSKQIDPRLISTPFNYADLVAYQEGAVVSRTVIEKTVGTVTIFAFDQHGLTDRARNRRLRLAERQLDKKVWLKVRLDVDRSAILGSTEDVYGVDVIIFATAPGDNLEYFVHTSLERLLSKSSNCTLQCSV